MNDTDFLIIRALLRAPEDCKVRHVPSGSRRISIPYRAVFRDVPISRSSLFDEEELWLQERIRLRKLKVRGRYIRAGYGERSNTLVVAE